MKLTLLEQITAGLNQQIDEAQALLTYLRKYGTDHPAEAAAPAAPLKPRKPIAERQRIKIGKAAAPVKRAAQPAPTTPATVEDLIAKPLTIGGAMKKLIAGLNKFTGQELRDRLLADPPVAKLIQERQKDIAGEVVEVKGDVRAVGQRINDHIDHHPK